MFEDVKLENGRMTVPELPKRKEGKHWVTAWPAVDLVEGDRVMLGFNEGLRARARVVRTWRSEQDGKNYGRYLVSFVYADNCDDELDGVPGTAWADDVYPILPRVRVGIGLDGVTLLAFDDWERAEDFIKKFNARVADEIQLDIEAIKADPDSSGVDDVDDYEKTVKMHREAYLVPLVMVPEWSVTPTVEL